MWHGFDLYFKSKNVVRIPSDCPVIDVKILEKGLNLFFKGKYTYVTNLCPPSYIDGNDVEIMSFNTLKKLHQNAKNKFDKEHVTTDLRRNINKYKFKNFSAKKNYSLEFRNTLDYKEDLMFFEELFNFFKERIYNVDYQELIKYVLKNEVHQINGFLETKYHTNFNMQINNEE